MQLEGTISPPVKNPNLRRQGPGQAFEFRIILHDRDGAGAMREAGLLGGEKRLSTNCNGRRYSTGHRRQVADVPVHDPEQGDDGGLVGGDRVGIAH